MENGGSGGLGGPVDAARQKRGYPDLAPLVLSLPPEQAFARVDAAARAMGWRVIASAPSEGRLEASDTARWFGFTDDIVVRVRPAPNGSRIDVRSASRVGAATSASMPAAEASVAGDTAELGKDVRIVRLKPVAEAPAYELRGGRPRTALEDKVLAVEEVH